MRLIQITTTAVLSHSFNALNYHCAALLHPIVYLLAPKHKIIQNVSAQIGRLVLKGLHPVVDNMYGQNVF